MVKYFKNDKKNVEAVVDQKLCTGCGGCFGVCSRDAIDMKLNSHGVVVPVVNPLNCTKCGICLTVCPGIEFNYIHFMNKIHGGLPSNAATGPTLSTYAGYTKDKSILNKAQSGGIVSEILIYGLENRLFDGAVVTGYRDEDPFLPYTYIADNREEVLKAVGSKYCTVPVSGIIKDLLKKPGRYAFVGTPCQIQSMRKAEDAIPALEGKIALYIGLHCLGVYNDYYIDQLLNVIKKSRTEIKEFKYREKLEAENAPATTVVFRAKAGEEFKLEGKTYRLCQRPYFTNWRCQLCFDKLNEFSDVSCGDCRIRSNYDKQEKKGVLTGLSDLIIRTKKGREILDGMVADNRLEIYESNISDIVTSTKVLEKKLGMKYARSINMIMLQPVPMYGISFDISKKNLRIVFRRIFSLVSMLHYYLCHTLIKYNWFRKMLMNTSPSMLNKMNKIRRIFTVEQKLKDSDNLKMIIDSIPQNAKEKQK